jgi:hypothetical protein
MTKHFGHYDFVALDIETKKEGINKLEATITKKSEGKLKDIVRLDKIIRAFNWIVYRSGVICRY